MKKAKKLLAIVLTLMVALAFGTVSGFAATQTVANDPADADNATITINNPAKGETYNIYKLFDATVGDDTIAYQGTVPAALSDFFEADDQGNITPKDAICEKDAQGKIIGTKMTDDLKAALETWAKSASAVATAKSDGSESLAFTGLPFGYYVMTTTHKPDGENAKAAITVTSTKPNASINDKNSNKPSAKKEVEKASYSIGETVKYTATFDTTNYMGEGANAKQVVDYVIKDTLPPYLSNVTVTEITIGGEVADLQQFDENKTIIIPWATKDTSVSPAKFTSLYDQGAKIVIKYQGVLTSTTNINHADKNTITITPEVDNDNGDKRPWDENWHDDADITTYAAAIHKVDQDGNDLPGAEFTIAGLTVEKVSAGVYRVVSYDASSTTASAAMATDDKGYLYIVGLASTVELTVTEFKEPEGYNKMDGTETLKPQVLSTTIYETSGERHYDADGNLVSESVTGGTTTTVEKNLNELDAKALEIENQQGTELPETGGIGTTIFYILGALLVIGCGIVLIARRRLTAK